jgi:hypothetical protein
MDSQSDSLQCELNGTFSLNWISATLV